MFYYFGYGSNLSLTSLNAKGVKPQSAQPAVLNGWQLRFNVQHFFRRLEGGVANVEYTGSDSDQVHGVLYTCDDHDLAPLDAMEAYGYGYDRTMLPIHTQTGLIEAIVYTGMPAFIDDSCFPCLRYRNILVSGAKHANLPRDYIQQLSQLQIHTVPDYPAFAPPPRDHPVFTETTLATHPTYTALNGYVFDLSEARPLHEYLKGFFGGRDMTLFHLKRLDTSEGKETLDDVRQQRYNKAQHLYLNGYLNEYATEYRFMGYFDYGEPSLVDAP